MDEGGLLFMINTSKSKVNSNCILNNENNKDFINLSAGNR